MFLLRLSLILALLSASSQALMMAPTPSDAPFIWFASCLGTAWLGALGDPSLVALEMRDVSMDAPCLIQTVDGNRETSLSSTSVATQHQWWAMGSSSLQAGTKQYSLAVDKARISPTMNVDVRDMQALSTVMTSLPSTLVTSSTEDDVSFGKRSFFLQPVPSLYTLTNENVVGASALGLGAIYGVSYAYYQYSIANEEAEAQRKKEKAAQTRTTAAKETAAAMETTEKEEEEAIQQVVVTFPAMSKEEEIAVEKARAAVERAKRFDLAARTAERKREVEQSVVVHEEGEETKPRRKRSWWKFWRRVKSKANEDGHH